MSEGLTLEQQFNLRSFKDVAAKMSRDQAIEFLGKLYEQMMLRESMYKHFLKHQWGIGESPSFVEEDLKRLIDCGAEADRRSVVKVSLDVPNGLYAKLVTFMEEFPEVPLDQIFFRALHFYLEKHGVEE